MHVAKCEARCCGKTEHTGNSEKERLAEQVLQDPPMYKNPPVCQSSYWNITTCTDLSRQQELLLVLSAGSVWSGTQCQLGQDMVTSRVKKATACREPKSESVGPNLCVYHRVLLLITFATCFHAALLQSWHPGNSPPWSQLPGALLRYSIWSQQGICSKATKPAWLLEALAQGAGGKQDKAAQLWPSHCWFTMPAKTWSIEQCLLKLMEQIYSNDACKMCHTNRRGDGNQVSRTQRNPIKYGIYCHRDQNTRQCSLLNFSMSPFSKVSDSISGKTSQALGIRDLYIGGIPKSEITSYYLQCQGSSWPPWIYPIFLFTLVSLASTIILMYLDVAY